VLGLAVVESATAIAMVEIDEGRAVTALGAYRKALPKMGSLLTAVLLVTVALVIVSFTAIGTLLAALLVVRWCLLPQVHVLENTSGVAALRRSARLVRGDGWRVASLLLFVTLLAVLLGPLCGTLLLFVTHSSFHFINLVASVIDAIVLPYAAIATTYLYFDLRVAKQGQSAEAEVLPMETATAS
jgi:ABC-type amino acid transport system permease subunit